jgi:hypothetical protein
MTSYHNAIQGDYSAMARTARRCIRAYMDLLHGGLYADSIVSTLSTAEMAVLREMVLEMYDDYPVMEVGNCILFIDDEINRRKELAGTGDRDG